MSADQKFIGRPIEEPDILNHLADNLYDGTGSGGFIQNGVRLPAGDISTWKIGRDSCHWFFAGTIQKAFVSFSPSADYSFDPVRDGVTTFGRKNCPLNGQRILRLIHDGPFTFVDEDGNTHTTDVIRSDLDLQSQNLVAAYRPYRPYFDTIRTYASSSNWPDDIGFYMAGKSAPAFEPFSGETMIVEMHTSSNAVAITLDGHIIGGTPSPTLVYIRQVGGFTGNVAKLVPLGTFTITVLDPDHFSLDGTDGQPTPPAQTLYLVTRTQNYLAGLLTVTTSQFGEVGTFDFRQVNDFAEYFLGYPPAFSDPGTPDPAFGINLVGGMLPGQDQLPGSLDPKKTRGEFWLAFTPTIWNWPGAIAQNLSRKNAASVSAMNFAAGQMAAYNTVIGMPSLTQIKTFFGVP